MNHHDSGDTPGAWMRHRWLNRLQTALLVMILLGIATIAGSLLFGDAGLWLALTVAGITLLIEPVTASGLTLRLYGTRALHPGEAPDLWALMRELAARTGLPAVPVPHGAPSAIVNAFATGSVHRSAIVLTDGLLRSLTERELTGVVAHEVAHVANKDLRVMGLADSVSRLTHVMALLGQIAILISLPALLLGNFDIHWPALILLVVAPRLALLAQLGLSRVREFDADRLAAELTHDPHGLALALAKIGRVSRSWRAWLLPGWGNPEPSWLRTHPATAERIERLRELGLQVTPQRPLYHSSRFPLETPVVPRSPRWRGDGLWRQLFTGDFHDPPRPLHQISTRPFCSPLAAHHRWHRGTHAAVAVPARHRSPVHP